MSDGCGIVVMRKGAKISMSNAKKLHLEVRQGGSWSLPWERTLFIAGEYTVPWDLVPSGFHFLQRWDAAAPLWRYGVLAADIGTDAERKRTVKVTLDLRIPLYEPALLFVQASEAGRALMKAWRSECRPGDDERLAFLRALHMVKPRFCALPRSWLAEEERRARQDAVTERNIRKTVKPLVTVEIGAGRSVKCHAGDEEKVRAYYATLHAGRAAGGKKKREKAEDKMRKKPVEDKAQKKGKEKAEGDG
jgi:hypothetical protein